jgi:predicted DNA-binding protein (MmcQ/YjbR family)
MKPEVLKRFIIENFEGSKADHPWKSDPDFTVFRHKDNRKWFALVFFAKKRQLMRLKPNDSLLMKHKDSEESIDIINVKVDREMIDDLVKIPGILPAYHMNRQHWVTILLDGSVEEGKLAPFIDLSYTITSKKYRRNKME